MYSIDGRVKFRANDTQSLVPAVTKLAGSHNLRMGADLWLIDWNSVGTGRAGVGSFSFYNTVTRSDPFTNSAGNTTGTSMASLLLGLFDCTSPSPVQVPGLLLRDGLLFAGTAGNPGWDGKVDLNNPDPRFGLAYQRWPNAVIPAGYGLFYAGNAGNVDTSISNGASAGYSLAATYVATTNGGASPCTTISDAYLTRTASNFRQQARIGFPLGLQCSFQPPDSRAGLFPAMAVRAPASSALARIRLKASFMRMLSVKGLNMYNLNEKPDQYLPLGSVENAKAPNPFFDLLPASTSFGGSQTGPRRQQ